MKAAVREVTALLGMRFVQCLSRAAGGSEQRSERPCLQPHSPGGSLLPPLRNRGIVKAGRDVQGYQVQAFAH